MKKPKQNIMKIDKAKFLRDVFLSSSWSTQEKCPVISLSMLKDLFSQAQRAATMAERGKK